MDIIYTWMKYGETLKPHVMRGVADNDCQLMVISSKCEHPELEYDEINIFNNRKEAIEQSRNDIASPYFIGIDSDVSLPKGCISKLKKLLVYHDVVIWPEKHNLFGIKKEVLNKYEFTISDKNHCSLCCYFEYLKLLKVDVFTYIEGEPIKDY